MNWLKGKIANLTLTVVLWWLRRKHVHLIDTSNGALDYYGEGRVIGGRVIRDRWNAVTGISVVWTSVGQSRPDYFHFPLESIQRHKVLGLVIDRA